MGVLSDALKAIVTSRKAKEQKRADGWAQTERKIDNARENG